MEYPSFDSLIQVQAAANARAVAAQTPPPVPAEVLHPLDPQLLALITSETRRVSGALANHHPERRERIPGNLTRCALWTVIEDNVFTGGSTEPSMGNPNPSQHVTEPTYLGLNGSYYYKQQYWPSPATYRTRADMRAMNRNALIPLSVEDVIRGRQQNVQESVDQRATRLRQGLAALVVKYRLSV